MDVKKIVGIFIGLMIMTPAAYALECDVDFRAKRVKTVSTWFGKVEKPEFKSGTLSGVGRNKKSCTRDALKGVERNGWKLTYQRIRRINRN
ncbi:MAG: hypothetical protein ACPGSM_02945 [Thiolinea sp.]